MSIAQLAPFTIEVASSYPDWLPSDLFALANPGGWWDFSSNDGLWQDAAGTTPVTALGQPIGLALEKSRWGGKTFAQVMSGQAELRGNGAAGVVGTATPGVYNTATGEGTVYRAAGTSDQGFVEWSGLTVSAAYRIDIENLGPTNLGIREGASSNAVAALIGVGSRTTLLVPPGEIGAGTGRITLNSQLNSSSTSFIVHSFREIPSIPARQTTDGARPLWQEDANGARGLKPDGVDDFLVTPSIDFSASDKMLVSAGVRKLSDAAIGIAAELSTIANANGAFYLTAPRNALTGDYGWRCAGGGNGDATTGNAYPAPQSSVLTGLGDISGDISRLRVNGSQVAESLANQGAGNFGNHPLYIGRRGGTSLPFNGFIHQLVVRGGDLPDAAELAKLEAYIAGKSGVSL